LAASTPSEVGGGAEADLGLDLALVGVEHVALALAGSEAGTADEMVDVDLNGQPFGRADAGVDMTFDFGTLIAHLARTRNIGAGSIIGSGTVSNRDEDGGPGKPIAAGGLGYSCIAEVRTVETILEGAAKTEFLKRGDTVRIWMDDEAGHPIFGVIEQSVVEG
jgi:fumarylacetoacetate (FAA) hydrolase